MLLPGRSRRSGDACPRMLPPPQLPSLLAISSLQQQQQQDFVLYMSRVLLLAVVCKLFLVLGLKPGWLVQTIILRPKRESIAEVK
ncbi:unnamed protein product [Sphagnum jensenii]|uniref:Uncharacterized protein n=1 Tax=Sphagnum jensenii TaxID=128206 RepID=A0ABP1ASV4_9BRYO